MAKDTKVIEKTEKVLVDETENKEEENISEPKEKIRKIYIGPSFRDFNLRHGDIYILEEEEVPKLIENCLKKQTEKTDQLKKEELKYFTSLKEMFIDIKEYSTKIGNHSKSGTIENARFNIIQEGIEKGVYN